MEYEFCQILRCSYSKVAPPISSAVMQSSMSVHDFMVLKVICMSGISLPLFFSQLCLDS